MERTAAVGLSLRTGFAMVVVLCGTRAAPEIVVRFEISLADPWVPESLHPYHRELGAVGMAGTRARQRGCRAARKSSMRAIRMLVRDIRAHGLEPGGIGLVVSSLDDPNPNALPHPRAHAAEGKLYREAVEAALGDGALRFDTYLEDEVRQRAAAKLHQTPSQIHARLKLLSHEVGTPWRAPEKNATLAAWMQLPIRVGRQG